MVSVRMVGSVRISCLRGAKSLGIEARHGAGSAVAQARGPFGLVVAATMMLALTLSMALATPAAAKPKYAALVLDKYSGRVLFSRHADAHRYPASLTKIMTLYIVFEELAKENITLDTKFTVSRHAAGQAPGVGGDRLARHRAEQPAEVVPGEVGELGEVLDAGRGLARGGDLLESSQDADQAFPVIHRGVVSDRHPGIVPRRTVRA